MIPSDSFTLNQRGSRAVKTAGYGQILTPGMIRAARALLGLDQAQVAERAGLHQRTISKVEGEAGSPTDPRRKEVLEALKEAFESEGIEFIFASEMSGEGV